MEDNVFEQMAKKYDTPARKELANIVVEEVRKSLRNSSSASLLDYGSGTGLVGLALVDLVKSVVLVDASEQMTEVAQSKILRDEIPNARALCSDFTEVTPEIRTDIIVMSLVLLHIPDTKNILQTLFNILNEGGKLIIVDFDKNNKIDHPKVHNGFSHEELIKLLSEVGFKTNKVNTFYHGEKIFMNQDASMFLSTSLI